MTKGQHKEYWFEQGQAALFWVLLFLVGSALFTAATVIGPNMPTLLLMMFCTIVACGFFGRYAYTAHKYKEARRGWRKTEFGPVHLDVDSGD